MRLIKKLTTVLSLSFLLTNSLHATTLEVPKLEDTFLYSNVKNILDGRKGLELMISATNDVYAKGLNFGVDTTSSNDWKQVITDVSGTPLSNIVALDVNNVFNCTVFLNDKGELWTLSDQFKYPKKMSIDDKVVKFAVTDSRVAYITATGECKFHNVSTDVAFTPTTQVDMTNIVDIVSCDYYTNGTTSVQSSLYFLHADGKVSYYIPYVGNTVLPTNLINVESIHGTSTNKTLLVKFNNGKAAYYNTGGTATLLPISEMVLDILSKDNGNYEAYIITTKTIYKLNTSTKVLTEVGNNGEIPVGLGYSLILTNKASLWNHGITTTPESHSNSDEIKQWMNTNPIPMDRELGYFEIDNNTVLDRNKKNYEMKFKLVTYQQPKAFNIYYSPTAEITNKSAWKVVESNVLFNSLNPVKYDTGYTDSYGDTVYGYTYTYNWSVGNENLTNIRMIAEPVY